MRITIRVTSFSAFWVVADSCCWAAACRWGVGEGHPTVFHSQITSPLLPELPALSPFSPSQRYLSDFANEAPVGEENDHNWDDEVDDEHVEDVGLVVVVGVVGVVVGTAGTLHPFRHVSASEKDKDLHQDPPWGEREVFNLRTEFPKDGGCSMVCVFG